MVSMRGAVRVWCVSSISSAPCPRHIVTIRSTDGAQPASSQSEPSRQLSDQWEGGEHVEARPDVTPMSDWASRRRQTNFTHWDKLGWVVCHVFFWKDKSNQFFQASLITQVNTQNLDCCSQCKLLQSMLTLCGQNGELLPPTYRVSTLLFIISNQNKLNIFGLSFPANCMQS